MNPTTSLRSNAIQLARGFAAARGEHLCTTFADSLSGDVAPPRGSAVVQIHHVVGVQHVAHLLSVPGDAHGRTVTTRHADRFGNEPADPPLIEGGELAAPVHGRVAKDDGTKPEHPRRVEDVLVRRPLRAPVR